MDYILEYTCREIFINDSQVLSSGTKGSFVYLDPIRYA